MAHFLLKTEPSVYSITDLEKQKKTVWDGVTNNLALSFIRSMHKGDDAFIYHTGDEKQVVGITRIDSDPYPDPHLKDPKVVVVDLKFVARLKKPVPLAEIKLRKELRDFYLVRIGRLSVMPVDDAQWELILSMSK